MLRKIAIPLLLGVLILAGCGAKEEAPKEGEKPPPPPATEQELYAQLRQPLDPMFSSVQSGAGFGNAQRTAAVEGLRGVKSKLAGDPLAALNSPQAFKHMSDDLVKLISDAKAKENWRAVKGGIESYKVFQPADKRFDEQEKFADLILARPGVEVEGFFELDGETVVFVEVTDATNGKKESFKIREGEDFANTLQLVRIIGRRDAIEILYKPVNQTWTVKAPSEKKKSKPAAK